MVRDPSPPPTLRLLLLEREKRERERERDGAYDGASQGAGGERGEPCVPRCPRQRPIRGHAHGRPGLSEPFSPCLSSLCYIHSFISDISVSFGCFRTNIPPIVEGLFLEFLL